MTRTTGTAATMLAGYAHTLATMLRLDLRDGTSLGITDHDNDLAFDIGDGEITYSSATGILPSDVSLATGLDSGNFEVAGPIGDTVTRAAILGGRYTRARARLFLIDWSDPGTAIPIMSGKVADARVEGSKFVLEVRNAADAFNQVIGRTVSPYCTADYGDAKCGLTRTAYPCTITAVSSAYAFTTDLGGAHDDGFFNYGAAAFLTGILAGTAEMEVFGYIGASGDVTLLAPMADPPQVGDTLNLYRGCSKLRMSDDAAQPTCLTYGNVVNFRGFPEVPGSITYLKVGVPGAAGA